MKKVLKCLDLLFLLFFMIGALLAAHYHKEHLEITLLLWAILFRMNLSDSVNNT